MSKKTLAMKVLESHSMSYITHQYPESERDAEKIAAHLGIAAARVFKTLVATREGKKPLLVAVPADSQLDLKKLARGVGEKKVKLALHRQAEQLTGLQVGGISPLALLNRGFEIVVDESAFDHATVCISAGEKGLNLEVKPANLVTISGAKILDVKS